MNPVYDAISELKNLIDIKKYFNENKDLNHRLSFTCFIDDEINKKVHFLMVYKNLECRCKTCESA